MATSPPVLVAVFRIVDSNGDKSLDFLTIALAIPFFFSAGDSMVFRQDTTIGQIPHV